MDAPANPDRPLAELERDRLFELSPDLLCVANFDGWLEQVNPAWTECLGWTESELKARPMAEFIHPEDLDASMLTRQRVLRGEVVRGFENRYCCKDGSLRWLSWNVRCSGGDRRIFAVARDITRRKGAERDLHAREAELRSAADTLASVQNALPAHIALIDRQGAIVSVNESWRRFSLANGVGEAEMTAGANYLDVCDDARGDGAEDGRAAADGIRAVLRGERDFYEMEYLCPAEGENLWFRLTVSPLCDGERAGAVVMHIDITAAKRAEEKIHRLNRIYAVSSGINEAIARIRDTGELYESACRIAVERGGLRMAWVGLAEREGEDLKPVASWGEGREYLDALRVTTRADLPGGCGPAGRAFRSGKPEWCNDIAAEWVTFSFRGSALNSGYRSCAVFPLLAEGRSIGILAVYGAQAGIFGEEEIQLLGGLAENLSFAVESHQRERARRQAEISLQESERRFRQLAENSRAVFWIMELKTASVLYVSPAFETIWGRSCESLYSNQQAWLEAVHGDDVKHVVTALQGVAEAGYDLTYRISRPDGGLRWIHDRASPVRDADGRVYRIAGTAEDVTARHAAEEMLREQATLLDHAQDAILVRDLKHRILYWNRGAERLYGWPAAEIAGRTIDGLLYRHTAEFETATALVLERGEWIGEIAQITHGGKSVTVEGRWTLLRDEAGRPRSILAINTDITRRKQLEQQFLRAQRMESIGTLAGGIAHDLNNVLAPILMSIDLLDRSVSDPRGREILGMIGSSARRAADMVEQVLTFARGAEGRRERVEPGVLIADLLKITGESFRKNVAVSAEVPHDLWPLSADPTQIHQVLLNLCMNARDAMPDGGSIRLRAANFRAGPKFAAMNLDARPGPYVRLEVEDTGSGMSPETLESVFDPFFTTKEVGKGTGLGLSTALSIVTGHGGFINVRSKVGRGSVFRIYLPVDGDIQRQRVAPPQAAAAAIPGGGGRRILLADDEPAILEIARLTLENHGYRVVTAVDGAEALARFRENPAAIDAIVTDMMMPHMDGDGLISELRKLRPDLPIVATSGVAGDPRKQVPEVRKFLAKPYPAAALLSALAEILSE